MDLLPIFFQVDVMIKNFVKNLWKKIQPKKVQKQKVFFLGNPITVFVSSYNYFSITLIAMNFFFSHEALFTRIIHSNLFLK